MLNELFIVLKTHTVKPSNKSTKSELKGPFNRIHIVRECNLSRTSVRYLPTSRSWLRNFVDEVVLGSAGQTPSTYTTAQL